MNSVEGILKKYKLSITGNRRTILKKILSANGALTHRDIEKSLKLLNRVSVYRTLKMFVEKGLIHRIPTTDIWVRYALCLDQCKAGVYYDIHVHFICRKCKKTSCLKDLPIPSVKLPKNFKQEHIDMLITGICNHC